MIVAYIITFIASLYLIIYGNLSLWLGLPLLIFSVSGISFQLIQIVNQNLRLNRLKKKAKAKWVGELTLIEGLNLVTNQSIHLILTRRDDLLLQAEQNEFQLNLTDIDGIFITKGFNTLDLTDEEICKFINRETAAPVFNNIRNLIRNNRQYAKKYIMLISLKLKEDVYYNVRMNQDLIIMILMHGNNNFRQFIKRPEIRSKVRYYNKRMEPSLSREEPRLDQLT